MARVAITHHDSPLGRWTRAFYFPDLPLSDHVEMFWHVSGRANYERDRRLPTGYQFYPSLIRPASLI